MVVVVNIDNLKVFTCDQVSLLFLMKDVQGHLQGHGLHVVPLEGGGDVHVHVQEPEMAEI